MIMIVMYDNEGNHGGNDDGVMVMVVRLWDGPGGDGVTIMMVIMSR